MTSSKSIIAVDEPRRVVLPDKVWRAMNWDDETPLEIWISPAEGEVVLKQHAYACVFCGAGDGLRPYNEKYICPSCRNGVAKL